MRKVVHFEIPCDDMERAKRFYSDIFGWQLIDVPGMDYTLARTVECDKENMPLESGAINGGIMKRDGTAKSPVLVIEVDDVDDHVKKVENAGGKLVMPKMPIGDMGFYARVSDPEGNVIGLLQMLRK